MNWEKWDWRQGGSGGLIENETGQEGMGRQVGRGMACEVEGSGEQGRDGMG